MQSALEICGFKRIVRALVFAFFILSGISSAAQQIKVSGVVLDSSNIAPIMDVHVYTKTTGTYTNSEGRFALFLNRNDTLFFSRIGYRSRFRQIAIEQSNMEVVLSEESTTLNTLIVYGSMRLGLPPLPEKHAVEGLYKYNKEISYAEDRYIPRSNGPGFSITIPWYSLNGEQKERKKINRYRKQNQSTAVYRRFIESDTLKTEMCIMFKISETDFYLKLENFAKNFPSAQFLQSEVEIKSLLIQSFATKSK